MHQTPDQPLEAPPAWNIAPRLSGKPLLIFDGDETLYFIPGPYLKPQLRPGAQELLSWAARHFDLMFWTAATHDWAEVALRQLTVPWVARWDRERCGHFYSFETRELERRKDLAKLKGALKAAGRSLDHVLIVEDHLPGVQRHLGNALRVPKFTGESDTTLLALQSELARLLTLPDWRRVRKGAFAP